MLRRRSILGLGVALASTSACRREQTGGSWRSFTPEEARTVDAICEQLIPADQDPGARQAGVVRYIDLQLARSFRRYRRAYREGIAGIEALSRSRHGKGFADLPAEAQTGVLITFEKTSRDFFDLILNHTRQGFYGDPRHGGNRHRVSWKMLKLPFPPLRGRESYRPSGTA